MAEGVKIEFQTGSSDMRRRDLLDHVGGREGRAVVDGLERAKGLGRKALAALEHPHLLAS